MINNNNNNMVVFLNLTCGNSHHEDAHQDQKEPSEFLKLTDEQEWSQLPTVDYSTHEPYFL
ncbi:hypothetical protein PS6_007346 [Mucor atramentarius]